MHSKASIFNLALGALLLQRQISDPANDTSNEAKVLLTHWDVALSSTLEDLDLDSTTIRESLELIATDPVAPYDQWRYVYKFPTRSAFFRKIMSTVEVDNRKTHIPKLIRLYSHQGQLRKVIITNQITAIGEFTPNDFPLSSLTANAAMAIAYRLAWLSAPLISGKGSRTLRKSLFDNYVLLKAEAQEQDRLEGLFFVDDSVHSEFAAARME